MTKLGAIEQSPWSILQNSKAARKAYDNAWNIAGRAPIFCKITKRTTKDGKSKKFYRKKACINKHPYLIAASGAAAKAASIVANECNMLREEVHEESARAPWLPQVSAGAKLVLEQFLCAISQEATRNAHVVREGSGTTKRINAKHMQLGWDVVIENVFANATLVPKRVFINPPVSKKAKKKEGGKTKDVEDNERNDDYKDDADEEE